MKHFSTIFQTFEPIYIIYIGQINGMNFGVFSLVYFKNNSKGTPFDNYKFFIFLAKSTLILIFFINIVVDFFLFEFCSILRGIALVVILMRAGLGLDPQALKRLSGMVFRLAFTPCLVETVVVAVASHLLLGTIFSHSLKLSASPTGIL